MVDRAKEEQLREQAHNAYGSLLSSAKVSEERRAQLLKNWQTVHSEWWEEVQRNNAAVK